MVRGLSRGLVVLQALNNVGEASSRQLAELVGLPRPTVHRLVETLRVLGFVARAHLRDTYHLTSLVHSLSMGHRRDDWLVEIATPVLQDLFERFVWPANISTFEDGAMVVRINTHRESPLSLVPALPGTRFPVLTTSLGQAYLAFCPEQERFWILETLGNQNMPDMQRATIEHTLQQVRRRGYGLREHRPGSRTASVAVPIMSRERVLACLNIVWIHSALKTEKAIEQFVEPLKAAAQVIEQEYLRLHAERAAPEPACDEEGHAFIS